MMNSDNLRGPFGVSLACGFVLIILILWWLFPLLGAVGRLGGVDTDQGDAFAQLVSAHDEAHLTDINRIHGRSFFFEPPSPPKPKPPEPMGACCILEECTVMARDACRDRDGRFLGRDSECTTDACEPKEVEPPPPPPPVDTRPKSYGGPDIIAIYGSDVIFRTRDGLMVIPVGRTLDQIQVVSTNAPRSAELMWKEGGPFTVPLVDKPEDPFADSGLRDVFEFPTTAQTRSVDENRPEGTISP